MRKNCSYIRKDIIKYKFEGEKAIMITNEMKELLKKISDLCYQASEEVFETEKTKDILDVCDKLQDMIDNLLEVE